MEKIYSTEYVCNVRVAGLGEIFAKQNFKFGLYGNFLFFVIHITSTNIIKFPDLHYNCSMISIPF